MLHMLITQENHSNHTPKRSIDHHEMLLYLAELLSYRWRHCSIKAFSLDTPIIKDATLADTKASYMERIRIVKAPYRFVFVLFVHTPTSSHDSSVHGTKRSLSSCKRDRQPKVHWKLEQPSLERRTNIEIAKMRLIKTR